MLELYAHAGGAVLHGVRWCLPGQMCGIGHGLPLSWSGHPLALSIMLFRGGSLATSQGDPHPCVILPAEHLQFFNLQ